MYSVGDMVEMRYTGLENQPVYFFVVETFKAGEKFCYKCYNVATGVTSTTYLPMDKTRKV